MEHLGQPQGFFLDQPLNTWVISAMKHLGQPQGSWISYGTLGSALRFLDQPWKT
jgi:hypothetical protein